MVIVDARQNWEKKGSNERSTTHGVARTVPVISPFMKSPTYLTLFSPAAAGPVYVPWPVRTPIFQRPSYKAPLTVVPGLVPSPID